MNINKVREALEAALRQIDINVSIARRDHPEGPVIDGKRLNVDAMPHSQDILASHVKDHIRDAIAALGAEAKATRDVLAERERQKTVEGWTAEHDDKHDNGELARAGGLYALIAGSNATDYRNAVGGYTFNDYLQGAMNYWPWNLPWLKPTTRRRDLAKAGALILAEIERLDRISPPEPRS